MKINWILKVKNCSCTLATKLYNISLFKQHYFNFIRFSWDFDKINLIFVNLKYHPRPVLYFFYWLFSLFSTSSEIKEIFDEILNLLELDLAKPQRRWIKLVLNQNIQTIEKSLKKLEQKNILVVDFWFFSIEIKFKYTLLNSK